MTEQEKQQLKAELMKEIFEEINSKNLKIKDSPQTALKTVREKWFRNNDNKKDKYSTSIMATSFDIHIQHRIWEAFTKLTYYINGEKVIRDLKDTDFANYVADKLCQTIYDLRKEYIEKSKEAL